MDTSRTKEPQGGGRTSSKSRSLLIFLAKAAVTVSLIVWLIRSDSLDFQKLRILIASKRVLLTTIVVWVSISVVLATLRWRILLQAIGVDVRLLRAAALQVTALFFNGLVPGNVGGDFVKNQAVLGNQPAKLVVLVLVERTVGLTSLVWAGGLGVLLSFDAVQQHPQLMPVAGAVFALMAGSVIGPWILFVMLRQPASDAERAMASAGMIGALRRGLHAASGAFRLIFEARKTVVQALLVSFFMHLGNIAYFLFLTRELGNPGAAFSEIAMIFPLGMITLALPISVSGFGVGHVMFNELFGLLGLQGGATIFNVFIVAYLSPALLGAIPYLFMKRDRGEKSKPDVVA